MGPSVSSRTFTRQSLVYLALKGRQRKLRGQKYPFIVWVLDLWYCPWPKAGRTEMTNNFGEAERFNTLSSRRLDNPRWARGLIMFSQPSALLLRLNFSDG